MLTTSDFTKIHDWLWEIPRSHRKDMRVPARIYASEKMLEKILQDKSAEQLINVTTLPGIQKYALAMPDAHEGYGFPIGGVAAFDLEQGIISPGGIGYDINCGIRLLRSELDFKDIKPYIENLSAVIYGEVPSGVGKGGALKLKIQELDKVLQKGASRVVEMGYGSQEDLNATESQGRLKEANPAFVSDHAKKRGRDQLGTLGAGNHFVEVDIVEEIFDEEQATKHNIHKNQICILIHTGSRGLGHQIATDYIKKMMGVLSKYKISLPDNELSCAPFNSQEGQAYWQAMCCGANYAWANRQMIMHEVRSAWQKVLGSSGGHLNLVYDVAHNIAKVEEYEIDGKKKKLLIHRKGATRSFPDQPVLIPGSMGTGSYLLVGQEGSMEQSFGSTCHGAGRRMSRTQARKEVHGDALKEELSKKGITINAGSYRGLAEEAPLAYKDVDEVVGIVDQAGIAKKVAYLKPIAVIKG
jgi:tRNA-splicing ligase RtcB